MAGTKRIGGAMLPSTKQSWSVAGVADFNGDNASDIIFKNTNGTARVWFMNNTNFLGEALLANGKVAGRDWKLNLVSDIDEDGNADLLWQRPDGTVVAWIMDQTEFSRMTAIRKATSGWLLSGFGDFNGDGHGDLLFQDASKRCAAWFMNGTNYMYSTTLANGASPGTAWSIAGPK